LFLRKADTDQLGIADSSYPNAPRAIIEAPSSQAAVRTRLAQLLAAESSKSARWFDGAKTIALAVRGWRFRDVDH
jgi:hypothetical protein